MLSSVVVASVLLGAASVRADPEPLSPSPGEVFNEGSECTVVWNPDTTGTWKEMNIELMSGPNENMTFLEGECSSSFARSFSLLC